MQPAMRPPPPIAAGKAKAWTLGKIARAARNQTWCLSTYVVRAAFLEVFEATSGVPREIVSVCARVLDELGARGLTTADVDATHAAIENYRTSRTDAARMPAKTPALRPPAAERKPASGGRPSVDQKPGATSKRAARRKPVTEGEPAVEARGSARKRVG